MATETTEPECVGHAEYRGVTYRLREYPYPTEEGFILPLMDGTDLLIPGYVWPKSMVWDFGTPESNSELVTIERLPGPSETPS